MSLIMIVAGSASVFLGVGSLPGGRDPSAVIDSELRFYAIWYVVAGLVLWRASSSLEEVTWLIRVIGIAFFAAGSARVLSWLSVGPPHWSQVVLLIIELTLPFVIIPWQAAVARGSSS
jgi:Domain of unknown function (DUF4345)